MGSTAYAASFVTESGFGSLSGLSSCKSGSNTTAFATGTVLGSSNVSGGCVGYFGVSIDSSAQTITLTGLEFGNYESGFLSITGITEVAITGLSSLTYSSLFAPNQYGEPSIFGGIPAPQLSFTSNSIMIGFSTYGETIPQFTYDGDGGTAVFAYTTTTPVPEPEIYAMMGLGLGLMGWVSRRRKQQVA